MSGVEHATWTIERTYPVPRSRVFAAWADLEVKRRWFVDMDGKPATGLTSDFVVGGSEHLSGTMPNGDSFTYDATHRDIVPAERIVMTYDMTINQRRISVSVATVELGDHDDQGTLLSYTEQGVYLDGLDTPEARRAGTAFHLDQLARTLVGS